MEIEKKRETSWKIQLKDVNEYIELTSVEVSGEVRNIKLSLSNKEQNLHIKMNKDEFFKFLSLVSAFKDVVIGEDSLILENELTIIKNKSKTIENYSSLDEDLYPVKAEKTNNSFNEKEKEELNPKEWDPW
ncbi:MAG: hypothetical protein EU539_01515 [Promethearchaeota archaeon]|nr:MAG: hypothetical protein EU539_01515 [Candidatus Lokiarchaeota archaeon]